MRGKQMRRRRAESSDDEENDNPGIKIKKLVQIREEQKQRKVRLGIQAASTLETERAGAGGSRKESKAAAEEEEDEAEQQRSIGEMMESSFTGMKYVTKDDTNVHERIMEQYIEERLGNVKEKAPEVVVPSEAVPPSKVSRREQLLAITEEIHARARGPAGDKAADAEGGVGEGAPIAFSTGIAEVALPVEFKLQNIEATERARLLQEEQLLLRQQGEKKGEIIGSLTHNYHHHRKEYAINMRAREGKPKGTFRREDGEGPRGRDTMTDDQVYAKFKKRKY